jgi:hypothetical protein
MENAVTDAGNDRNRTSYMRRMATSRAKEKGLIQGHQ